MANTMESTDESLSKGEMLEKIAELDYSQSQLRDLNAEMRRLLDVADDEITILRTENDNLGKQLTALKKEMIEQRPQDAEPCMYHVADDLYLKKCSETKIHDLEKEATMFKNKNKKLVVKVKNLEDEREQNRTVLNKQGAAMKSLEFGLEEAQLALQRRDEVIHQKNLQLKHLEETVEEYSDIIKDLRRTKQELNKQLEDSREEASLASVTDMIRSEESALIPQLSLAEEIVLTSSTSEGTQTSLTDLPPVQDITQYNFEQEIEAEDQPEPDISTPNPDSQSLIPGKMAVQGGSRLMFCILCLIVLVVVVLRWYIACSDFFFLNFIWNNACVKLQPYASLHYGALPPV